MSLSKNKFEKMVASIQDRTVDVRSVGNDLLDAWGFDLENRRPGLAYVTPDGKPVTSLDMACILNELVKWGSVINIPTYKAQGPRTIKEGEIVTSKENRHGKITGLVGNADTFNFSMRIIDANVMTAKDVGQFRNFLVMANGEWHQGFRSLEFQPTEQEKQLLARIPSDNNTVLFDSFVSLNRWPSVYGRYYLAAKLLIDRLKDQRSNLTKQISAIRKELGIDAPTYPKTHTVGDTKKVKVVKFNAEVTAPNDSYTGEYPTFPITKEGLEDAQNLKSRLGQIRDRLAFQTRASEYAFFQKAVLGRVPSENVDAWQKGAGTEQPMIPAWVTTQWTTGVRRTPRSNPWVTIDLDGYTLRFHVGKKQIQVAAY